MYAEAIKQRGNQLNVMQMSFFFMSKPLYP